MKFVYLDMDDTLLNERKEITPGNAEAIGRALAEGNKVIIATGRPLGGTIETMRALHLTEPGCFAICFNGGLVYDCEHDRVLKRVTIPIPLVHRIFEAAEAAGVHCQTYDSHDLLVKAFNKTVDHYVKGCPTPWRIEPDLPNSLSEEPAKCLLIDLDHPEKLEMARRKLDAIPGLTAFYSHVDYLEVVREGISKGDAIRFLTEYLGGSMADTIGIGDSENDIPMLAACAVGCAVANASSPVKEAADYVTERDCETDAVAEVFNRFVFNGI